MGQLIYFLALDFLRSFNVNATTLRRGYSVQSSTSLLNKRISAHQTVLQDILLLKNKSIFHLTTLEPATDYKTLKSIT